MTRSSRSGNDASQKHRLSLYTTLPIQKVALSVVRNKVQPINLICRYFINHIQDNLSKLVMTGKDPTPVQVGNNSSLQREDLKTNHEEFDIIIPHHLIRIESGASDDSYIMVVCGDTDDFVLLIHFYLAKKMTMHVSIEKPCPGRTIICIHQTALKHKHVYKHLPVVHALAGYDKATCMFGIGKVTALTVLMGGHHFIEPSQQGADEDEPKSEAATFVAACYGSKVEGDMPTHHYQMWDSKN